MNRMCYNSRERNPTARKRPLRPLIGPIARLIYDDAPLLERSGAVAAFVTSPPTPFHARAVFLEEQEGITMPKLLPAHNAPTDLPPNDFGRLLLSAEDVIEALIKTIPATPLGHPQRAALVSASNRLACTLMSACSFSYELTLPHSIFGVAMDISRQITTKLDSDGMHGLFADSCGRNNGAQT